MDIEDFALSDSSQERKDHKTDRKAKKAVEKY